MAQRSSAVVIFFPDRMVLVTMAVVAMTVTMLRRAMLRVLRNKH